MTKAFCHLSAGKEGGNQGVRDLNHNLASVDPGMKPIASNFYVRNSVIWLCYLLFVYLVTILHSDRSGATVLLAIFAFHTLAFVWIIFHNRLLIDRLLLRDRKIWYIACLPAGFAFWLSFARVLDPLSNYPFKPVRELILFVLLTTIGGLFFLSAKYFWERKQFYQLTYLKREVELSQLKAQLNPHFLFNALNNIYSYTLQRDEFGSQLILKLGELMRFILESAEKETIDVGDEAGFIENYIAFETERLGDRCQISYSKEIRFARRQIAPLILFPFVENAFKYGANTIQRTSVDIRLCDTEGTIRLTVTNSQVNKAQTSTKKGLPMARRRLELLYPQKHALQIEAKDELFTVDLTLHYADR
jgi:two-component system LytT family sensor kinase